jgi:hypothetical protein
MGMGERGHGHDQVLRIQADEDLPEHKVAASLDDLDRDILEMYQKDVALSVLKVKRLAMHCGPGSKRCTVGPQFVFWAAPEERAMGA